MYDVASSISVEQKFLWVLIYADNNKIKFSLKLKYMHDKKLYWGESLSTKFCICGFLAIHGHSFLTIHEH